MGESKEDKDGGLGFWWTGMDLAWLGLSWAEWPLRVFTWEACWRLEVEAHNFIPPYSWSAMDEPPQALSPLPTASLAVWFSSPFSYCKTLMASPPMFLPLLLFWVCLCFCFCFWRECEGACFSGFFVCLFPKIISGFMGLLENGLVTMFMGLFMVWFGFLDLFLVFLGFMHWQKHLGDCGKDGYNTLLFLWPT